MGLNGALVGLVDLLANGKAQLHWPLVQRIERQTTIVFGRFGGDTPFVLDVNDSSGRVVYRLECHNGDYEDQTVMNFSGDFQCALFAVKKGKRMSGNLLVPEDARAQNSDWLNRGRMVARQLMSDCEKYAEYGAVSSFHSGRSALLFTSPIRYGPRQPT